MVVRSFPTSSCSGALGQSRVPLPEGTLLERRCQRGQPSTSTFGLRVASGDGPFRHCDVEIVRPTLRRQAEPRDDATRDRNLDAEVDGRAEPDLEAAAKPERDLSVERADERDLTGETAPDERGERASREAARLSSEQRAELD